MRVTTLVVESRNINCGRTLARFFSSRFRQTIADIHIQADFMHENSNTQGLPTPTITIYITCGMLPLSEEEAELDQWTTTVDRMVQASRTTPIAVNFEYKQTHDHSRTEFRQRIHQISAAHDPCLKKKIDN